MLAAITASFLRANKVYRRPVAAGGGSPSAPAWPRGSGIPALIVLLIVMNWFFHKVYWTGWIASHHKRRRSLLSADAETNKRRMLLGLGLLGFTSVYRECFEIVIFLQNLR